MCEVEVGDHPRGVSVNPNINRIYVVNEESDSISVIDGVNDLVIETVAVGKKPNGIVVNPENGRIYVSCYEDGAIWVLKDETGIEESEISKSELRKLKLEVWPNPFRGKAVIRCWIPDTHYLEKSIIKHREFSIQIYDLAGRLVCSLPINLTKRLINSITWDGTDDLGRTVETGIYFIKLKVDDFSQTKKIVLLK
jgi:YVTN family beta-propeller protein